MKKQIAIFASGSGTNAECIARYFENSDKVEVAIILSNNKEAYVLERAKKLNIATHVFSRNEFYHTTNVIEKLADIDIIVLAGFLWLIPPALIQQFPKRIINIHPALLPHYGGKGMYGDRVHKAVIAAKEPESGITIHYVNETYDDGATIFQAKCKIASQDTPEQLATKIHALEHAHFPKVIEQVATTL